MLNLKEPFNSLSHGVGALLAVAGLVGLEFIARGISQVLSYSIYGITLVLTYTASTLYHGVNVTENVEAILLKIDRSSIGLLIAGSFTPIVLLKIGGLFGAWLLAGIWSFAFVMVAINVFLPPIPSQVSALAYLSMGWLGLLAIEPLLHSLSVSGFFWLVSGGLFYTAGAIVYSLKRPHIIPGYFEDHELWHVFTLMGSGAHYICIFGYTA